MRKITRRPGRWSGKPGARGICCDVADPQAVAAAFAPLEELDILINNAGVAHYGLMSQVSPETWDRVFAVNVKGMYLCANAATPLFLKHHRGCILNVASMWGQVGASCEALYSATKGAVIALTKALAKELGPSGIRVNAVSPGVILTDMVANVEPAVLQELQQENLVGRNGLAGGYCRGAGVPGGGRICIRPGAAGERRPDCLTGNIERRKIP